MRSTRTARRLLVLLVMAGVALVPATAGAATFPDTIGLPDGWQPEGIAAGRGTSLYVGSIPTGAVWKGDARTGQGDVLVPGQPGVRSAIGIKVDRRNRLFVAARGGRTLLSVQTVTGKLFRINPRTGVTREVDLGRATTLENGDGMLLAGRVLFVVQNRSNQIVRVG